ncbi:MAG: peptide ABC transporter substrate-binding protein, partial [Bdellovibrionaceae bacterium]|nr:peptide ABC transporter substrate-binding protein [Pseudobdellovibrionaceae bacterium]
MRNLFIALIVSFSLALNAASKPTNNELKIGISQEFETLNPVIMTMVASSYMHYAVGRRLVNMDPNNKWVPQITKEIPSIENGLAKIITEGGKKKIQTQWEILENVKWGDGKPVTCEDIAFTRKVALTPTISVGEKETYSQIERIDIDAKNKNKCTFTYEKAKWDHYTLGTFYLLPKHLEEGVYEKYKNQKEGYEKNSNYVKNPTNPGLYNGPYVVSEVKLGDHVSMIPNKFFYGESAKIKKIIFRIIPNTGTLEANLRSGTIDMISVLGLTFDQALELEKKVKSENLDFIVKMEPSSVHEHIDLNLDNPILKDVRVRKAMATAIDKDQLVKSFFDNRQPASMHFMTSNDPWFTNDPKFVTSYKFSKRTAAKMLEEAGWKEGKDGYRYKDGKKLSLVFMTTAGNKTREAVQTYLQNQWKAVGIEVVPKNEPGRVFFGETTKKRKFDMAMYAWVSSPENTPRSTLHSSSIASEKNGWSGQNYPGWKNARMDKLIDDMDLE